MTVAAEAGPSYCSLRFSRGRGKKREYTQEAGSWGSCFGQGSGVEHPHPSQEWDEWNAQSQKKPKGNTNGHANQAGRSGAGASEGVMRCGSVDIPKTSKPG